MILSHLSNKELVKIAFKSDNYQILLKIFIVNSCAKNFMFPSRQVCLFFKSKYIWFYKEYKITFYKKKSFSLS